MLFEVLQGFHVQEGMMYPKGSLVESDQDLEKVFKNKFVCHNRPPETKEDKTRPVPMSVMGAGASTLSNASPAPIKGKNDNVSGQLVIEQVQALADHSQEKKPFVKQEPDVVAEHPKYGKDITKSFPKAIIANLKVYYNGAKYKVVDPESDLGLNKKKLINTKDVDAFLMARLEG